MGLVIDIRKFDIDNLINDLVDASKIKRNWLGKVTDIYWDYLGKATKEIKTDLNAYIIADFFIYLVDKIEFKETLSRYSKTLSDNRNQFVIILLADDKELIKTKICNSDFISDFEIFCKDLNGGYYDYSRDLLNENIEKLKLALDQINEDNGLIINIG